MGNNPINANDPSGKCVNCLAAAGGAVIGGVVGGISSYITSKGDWNEVAKGAAIGAVTGAWSGFTFGTGTVATAGIAATATVGRKAVGGAIEGFVGGATVETSLQVQKNRGVVDATDVLISGAVGVVPGAMQGVLGKYAVKGQTGNALGGQLLTGQYEIAMSAAGAAASNMLPHYKVDVSPAIDYAKQYFPSLEPSRTPTFPSSSSGLVRVYSK